MRHQFIGQRSLPVTLALVEKCVSVTHPTALQASPLALVSPGALSDHITELRPNDYFMVINYHFIGPAICQTSC